MSLRDDILAAYPGLTPANRDDGAIAVRLSVGRTRTVSPTYVGIGAILRVLGPVPGAAFLDHLQTMSATNSVVKWGLVMITAGTLDVGDPLTIAQINAYATAGVLTTDQAASLIAAGVVPDPVTPDMVAQALEGFGDEVTNGDS